MKHLQHVIILSSVVTLTVMSSPVSLLAQSVGDRVRVTTDDDKMTGTINSVNDNGFLLYRPGAGRLAMKFSDINLLERRIKSGSYWKSGGILGFAIGGTAGAFLGWFAANFDITISLYGSPSRDSEEGKSIIAGIFIVGVSCGLLGSGIGALIKRHKWETIPIPSMRGRLRISPMFDVASIGGNRRTILGARIRF